MAYASSEKWKNTGSGALSLGATGAGIGTAIAPGIGTAIGAGVGAFLGGIGGYFMTDDEKNELIEAYREGKLDDQTVANIEGAIARRYDIMRRSQNAGLARRGIGQSSFAARQIAGTFNSERDALANALTQQAQQRQLMGFQMSDAAGAQRAQQVADGIGTAFQGYQLYQQNAADVRAEARADKMLEMIGKHYTGSPLTTNPNPMGVGGYTPDIHRNSPFLKSGSSLDRKSIANSQTGAGNAFARQRTRMPNVKFKPNITRNSPFLKSGQSLASQLGR